MVTYAKISPKSGEPQRYSWGTQKKKKKRLQFVWCSVVLDIKTYGCDIGQKVYKAVLQANLFL